MGKICHPNFCKIKGIKKLQNHKALEFLEFCGVSGGIEHLVLVLTFFESIK